MGSGSSQRVFSRVCEDGPPTMDAIAQKIEYSPRTRGWWRARRGDLLFNGGFLIDTHVCGVPAGNAPVLHLRLMSEHRQFADFGRLTYRDDVMGTSS